MRGSNATTQTYSPTMSAGGEKKSRTEPEKPRLVEGLNEDVEGRITNFLTDKELCRVHAASRAARNLTYSPAMTKIVVPRRFRNIPTSFWQLYNLSAITEIDGIGSQIKDADLRYVAQHCANLSVLKVLKYYNDEESADITNAGVIALSQGCPELSKLDLCGCREITDAGVIALAQGCPELSDLNLRECDQITDEGVMALAQNCKQLSFLGVGVHWPDQSANITDAGVAALAQGCPQLCSLSLSGCRDITDTSVIALAQQRPELCSLSLDGCKNITIKSVLALAQECPKLSWLNLKGCDMSYRKHRNINADWKAARELFSRNLQQKLTLKLPYGYSREYWDIYPGRYPSGGGVIGGSGGGSSSSGTGGAASQLAPRRMRLSYRARF